MAKSKKGGLSLKDQLLSAGLTDTKKAKAAERALKQQKQKQRRGDVNEIDELRAQTEATRLAKAEEDLARNQALIEAQRAREITAQINQMIKDAAIKASGEIKYQFVHGTIKAIYVDQESWNHLAGGRLAIVQAEEESYKVLPTKVAQRIAERGDVFVFIAEKTKQTVDEDDPYAAYQIPDDLMW